MQALKKVSTRASALSCRDSLLRVSEMHRRCLWCQTLVMLGSVSRVRWCPRRLLVRRRLIGPVTPLSCCRAFCRSMTTALSWTLPGDMARTDRGKATLMIAAGAWSLRRLCQATSTQCLIHIALWLLDGLHTMKEESRRARTAR